MSDARSAVIIGGGTAGLAAARTLARGGWKVTVAEPDRLGGTCLWRGCVPKKALYQTARTIRAIRKASTFGVECGQLADDWNGALAWKWHAQETYAGDQSASLERRGIVHVAGSARFTSPDAVSIDDTAYTADAFVIATGSRPVVPAGLPGADLGDTSDDVLRWSELPGTAVIAGGGFVGVELAGILASWGVRCTVVTSHDRVLDTFDAELSDAAMRGLAGLGVEFVTEARLTTISGEPGALTATVARAGGDTVALGAERVVLAIGRAPDLADLGLEEAGVELDRGRVVHDAFLRTTNPKVWVAGDAAGGMMQTPIANLEGRTVARSIVDGVPVSPDCSAAPVTAFTVPQVATVGLTESGARDAGYDVLVSRTALGDVAEAIIEDERDGFVKLIAAEPDHRILGAQIAAPNAADLIYPVAIALKAGWTLEQLGEVPAIHPSMSEAVYFSSR